MTLNLTHTFVCLEERSGWQPTRGEGHGDTFLAPPTGLQGCEVRSTVAPRPAEQSLPSPSRPRAPQAVLPHELCSVWSRRRGEPLSCPGKRLPQNRQRGPPRSAPGLGSLPAQEDSRGHSPFNGAPALASLPRCFFKDLLQATHNGALAVFH